MQQGDLTIYTGFHGKMTRVKSPKGRVENANFVITYNGRDWSGFRTLAECEQQFAELEAGGVERCDRFAVVER